MRTVEGRRRAAELDPFDEDHETQVDEYERQEDDLRYELEEDAHHATKEP